MTFVVDASVALAWCFADDRSDLADGWLSRLASGQGVDLADSAVDVAGTRVVAARVDGADAKSLREAVDAIA